MESIRNFNVRAKVVGPSVRLIPFYRRCVKLTRVSEQGSFVKYIQQETGTRVQIKGVGSGFIEQETGRESDEPLYIHITYAFPSPSSTSAIELTQLNDSSSGPDEGQVQRAKVLTEDLLLVVRQEHAKMQAFLQQQQMELHQAQAQYAAYSAMAAVGILILSPQEQERSCVSFLLSLPCRMKC